MRMPYFMQISNSEYVLNLNMTFCVSLHLAVHLDVGPINLIGPTCENLNAFL